MNSTNHKPQTSNLKPISFLKINCVLLLFFFSFISCENDEISNNNSNVLVHKREVIDAVDNQSCDEFNPSCTTDGPFGQPYFASYTLEYLGCPIKVSFWVHPCSGIQHVYFTDFNITLPNTFEDSDCISLKIKYRNNFDKETQTWNYDGINRWYLDMYKVLSKQAELIWFNNELNGQYTGWVSSFIESKCIQLCIIKSPDNELNFDLIKQVQCGESCCVRYTYYKNDNPNDATVEIIGNPICRVIPFECAGKLTGICNNSCVGLE